jgi:hypothetical protein
MWARLLAAVMAIAIAGGAAWWFWLGPGTAPPADACGAAERVDVPGAPAVFEPTVFWQLAELPALATDGDEQVMLGGAAFHHGWVASGRSSSGPDSNGFILSSPDGFEWRYGPADAAGFADTEIGLLVERDRTIVAVGSASGSGQVGIRAWISHDGIHWRSAAGPFDRSSPTAVGNGDQSLLLFGVAESGDHPLAWSSSGGNRWERVDLQLPVDPELARIGAIQSAGEGWLAVGDLSRGVDSQAWPVVWTSADGVSWSCLLLDRAGFDVARPTALHRSAQGWLAVASAGDVCGFGASCPGDTVAWTSPDGVQWSAGATGVAPWDRGGIAIAGSAEGFVAAGHGTTWWSADGNSWVELADGGTAAGALIGQPDALVMTDDGRILAVGTTYEGVDADAWVAVGYLSR